jgi:hypothetical protein
MDDMKWTDAEKKLARRIELQDLAGLAPDKLAEIGRVAQL